MALQDREGAEEVARLAAPAAADLEVLAVDLPVRVDLAVADVGVVPGDDVAPADAREIQSLGDGRGGAGGFDHDVRAFAVGRVEHGLAPAVGRRGLEIERDVGAHLAREREPARGRADRDDARGAGDPGQRDRAQADGARRPARRPCRRAGSRRVPRCARRSAGRSRRRCSRRARRRPAGAPCRRRARGRSPAPIRRTAPRSAESVMP